MVIILATMSHRRRIILVPMMGECDGPSYQTFPYEYTPFSWPFTLLNHLKPTAWASPSSQPHRRADAAQVCSDVGMFAEDGKVERSAAPAARQIVSERW
jgi:hypothetical protein